MSEVVNLRLARKRAVRKAADAEAAANRAKHGRGKGERIIATAEAARIAKTLNGAKRKQPDDD